MISFFTQQLLRPLVLLYLLIQRDIQLLGFRQLFKEYLLDLVPA